MTRPSLIRNFLMKKLHRDKHETVGISKHAPLEWISESIWYTPGKATGEGRNGVPRMCPEWGIVQSWVNKTTSHLVDYPCFPKGFCSPVRGQWSEQNYGWSLDLLGIMKCFNDEPNSYLGGNFITSVKKTCFEWYSELYPPSRKYTWVVAPTLS